jgi:DNA-binding CsgD family transcriptional regulator
MAGSISTLPARLTSELPELYALGPLEQFSGRVLSVVERLIGCDSASYNEIDTKSGTQRVVVTPEEATSDELAHAFAAHVHEHPVIMHVAATGDPRSYMVSDFLGPRDLRRLALYSELFAPLGIEDQLAVTMPATRDANVIGVALNRGKHGFSEQDRTVLNMLRPHLLVAYTNALRYSAALTAATANSTRQRPTHTKVDRLTDRQLEVLGLVSRGHTNHQIAYELGVSVGTVKKHMEHILNRLDTPTRVAAAIQYLAAAEDAQPRLAS